MRAAARIVTVLLATSTTAVVLGGMGSALTSPADAPTTTVATSTAAPHAPAASDARIGTSVLPEGVLVPPGTKPVGTPHAFSDGGLRGWETTLDLGDVPAAAALAMVRSDLAAQGFALRGGTHDVFGARQRAGRWEIVVARVETHGAADRSVDVLTIGVGSRPA